MGESCKLSNSKSTDCENSRKANRPKMGLLQKNVNCNSQNIHQYSSVLCEKIPITNRTNVLEIVLSKIDLPDFLLTRKKGSNMRK